MRLVAVETSNVRNLVGERLRFSGRVNLISGGNGEGKTNLLEAIALLGNLRSFRTRTVSRVVTTGERAFEVRGEIAGRYGTVSLAASFDMGPPVKKRLVVSGKSVGTAEYLHVFPVVAVTREDSELVHGAPQGRRSFLDRLAFQIDRQHFDRLVRYRRALAHRNAALGLGVTDAEMAVWEAKLAAYGAEVVDARRHVLERLVDRFEDVIRTVCAPGFPSIRLKYRAETWIEDSGDGELENSYRERYAVQRQRDRDAGFTSNGPHRHDVVIEADGRPARGHLSTGQVKLVAASLRTAALELVEAERHESFPMLIDDIDAELDEHAVERLMIRAGADRQLFVTSASTVPAARARIPGMRFEMRKGVCRATGDDVHE